MAEGNETRAADQVASETPRDEATVAYFDEVVPEYGTARLEFAARFIAEHSGPESSLIDLGCGTGNTLVYLSEQAGIDRVAGLDVSRNCLERLRARLDCETHHGSILDDEVVAGIEGDYDFAIVAAVLHHLIGRTRAESKRHAMLAIDNALALLKPGGHLIVHEPIYYPSWAMSAVFYVKKGVTRITGKRVPLLGYWNNIGAPVVSYYTNEELTEMLARGGGELVAEEIRPEEVPRAVRRVIRKTSTTLVLRKPVSA